MNSDSWWIKTFFEIGEENYIISVLLARFVLLDFKKFTDLF